MKEITVFYCYASRKTATGNYRDIAHPINPDVRKHLINFEEFENQNNSHKCKFLHKFKLYSYILLEENMYKMIDVPTFTHVVKISDRKNIVISGIKK